MVLVPANTVYIIHAGRIHVTRHIIHAGRRQVEFLKSADRHAACECVAAGDHACQNCEDGSQLRQHAVRLQHGQAEDRPLVPVRHVLVSGTDPSEAARTAVARWLPGSAALQAGSDEQHEHLRPCFSAGGSCSVSCCVLGGKETQQRLVGGSLNILLAHLLVLAGAPVLSGKALQPAAVVDGLHVCSGSEIRQGGPHDVQCSMRQLLVQLAACAASMGADAQLHVFGAARCCRVMTACVDGLKD